MTLVPHLLALRRTRPAAALLTRLKRPFKVFFGWLVDHDEHRPLHLCERHPLPDDSPNIDGLTPEQALVVLVRYVHYSRCLQARLWDQVWWMQLPRWRRWIYRCFSFRAPIQRFYIAPGEQEWK